MNRPACYWHSGGEVLGPGGQALTDADIEALHGLHMEEAKAARAAIEHDAGLRSHRLALELARATDAATCWRRAGGAVGERRIIFP